MAFYAIVLAEMAKRTASLLLSEKVPLECGLLREVVVWAVPESAKYPDGVKYHLALVNPLSGEVVLLFDNHFPKGHHRHAADGKESPIFYTNLSDLLTVYYEQERQEIQNYESNED
jgi:hypothetical protein